MGHFRQGTASAVPKDNAEKDGFSRWAAASARTVSATQPAKPAFESNLPRI